MTTSAGRRLADHGAGGAGAGAAVITPLSLTILSSAFPPERRGAIIGIWGGISGLGVAAGAAALIWAVIQGSQTGWTGTDVLAGLPLGAVLLGAFLIW